MNTVSVSNFPQACYDQISLPELQNGVQVMIFVAFIIVALVIIYAILYQVVIPPKKYQWQRESEVLLVSGSQENLAGRQLYREP